MAREILIGIKDGVSKVEKIALTAVECLELKNLKREIKAKGEFKGYDTIEIWTRRGVIFTKKISRTPLKLVKAEAKKPKTKKAK